MSNCSIVVLTLCPSMFDDVMQDRSQKPLQLHERSSCIPWAQPSQLQNIGIVWVRLMEDGRSLLPSVQGSELSNCFRLVVASSTCFWESMCTLVISCNWYIHVYPCSCWLLPSYFLMINHFLSSFCSIEYRCMTVGPDRLKRESAIACWNMLDSDQCAFM